MAVRALIFDVDGTLAETEEAHRVAFNDAFAEAGHDWNWSVDLYRDLLLVTGGAQRIRHFLDTIAQTASPDEITALHRNKNARYAAMVAGGALKLRPGVARLIDEARHARLPLAIATTTTRSNLDALLTHLFPPGATSWFDAIVTGEDVAHKKPHPEAYRRALDRLGIEPRACVAFEDSRNGLRAATACAIPTVVTPSRFTSHEDFTGAMLIRPDLDRPKPLDLSALGALICGVSR